MSTFMEYVLPHFTLEELVVLRYAVAHYLQELKRIDPMLTGGIEQPTVKIAQRLSGELIAECERRFTALSVGGG